MLLCSVARQPPHARLPCPAELINTINIYLRKACSEAHVKPDGLRLAQAAHYITKILACFGLTDGLSDNLGFTSEGGGSGAGNGGDAAAAAALRAIHARFASDVAVAAPDTAAALRVACCGGAGGAAEPAEALDGLAFDAAMDRFAGIRDAVRALAQTPSGGNDGGSRAALAGVLAACDAVRDGALVDIGVRLEDRGQGTAAVWKRVDPSELRREVRLSAGMFGLNLPSDHATLTLLFPYHINTRPFSMRGD
jgi:hypothetical protein